MKITLARTPTPAQQDLERQQLARFASLVTDEAHWQAILASTQESQREELERVVGPMLPFRRARPCTTPDCASGKPGTYRPVLEVRSPFDREQKAWVPIELHLCEDCQKEADIAHFLTDDIWHQIMLAWNEPEIPPVRRLTTLAWERSH